MLLYGAEIGDQRGSQITRDFERVLVYGAGKGGELTIRELRSNAALRKVAVGFLDDDPVRKGMTLHGLPVLGSLDSLAAILAQQRVDAILVSTRKLSAAREAQLTVLARNHELALYRLHIAVVPFETATASAMPV